MPERTVSILGCGWLGLPLAQLFVKNNYRVKGSTTTLAKLALLKQENILPYHLVFQPQLQGNGAKEFLEADILFLNIPFKRDLPAEFYRHQIQSVISYLEGSPIKDVIFTSSTAVYPETNGIVDETTPINKNNERARVLSEIEQMFLLHRKFRSVVIRFVGLFGPGRAIGSFFNKIPKEKLYNAPTNLIYLQDCLGIVDQVIKQKVSGDILNACSDDHPLRKDLYAKFLSPELMRTATFIDPKENSYKIVSNEKLKRVLQYKFFYPNPLMAPQK